jgi:NAD(P)H-flavin reductase
MLFIVKNICLVFIFVKTILGSNICYSNNNISNYNLNYYNTLYGWNLNSNDNIASYGQKIDINKCNYYNLICNNWFTISNYYSVNTDLCNLTFHNIKLESKSVVKNNITIFNTEFIFNYIDKKYCNINYDNIIIFTRLFQTNIGIIQNQSYLYLTNNIYNNNTELSYIVLNDNFNYLKLFFKCNESSSFEESIDLYNIYNYFKYFKFNKYGDYEAVIIVYSLIILMIIFFLSINKCNKNIIKNLVNKTYKIYYIGYVNSATILFSLLYIIFWSTFLIYSFLTNDKIMARLGTWITLNISMSLFPVTRNSIWVIFFNISKERITYVHRFIATLCLISIIIKFITSLIFYDLFFLSRLINIKTGGSPLFGVISSLLFIILGLLSIIVIRKKMFEVFYYSHRILTICGVIFGILHYISTLYYLIPCLLLYFTDLIRRVNITYKSIYSKLKNIQEVENDTSYTLIHITIKNKIKTFPGCYFFLCFYNDISRFQWHPLSLVSYENDILTFCCKNIGQYSWTNRLHDNVKNNYDMLVNRNVYIQGPYANLLPKYIDNMYDNIIIVAGGIGITPMITILDDINKRYNKNQLNKLKNVRMVWVLKNTYLYISFNKYFSNLNKQLFDIHIYITQKINDFEIDSTLSLKFEDIINCHDISNKRPNIKKLLKKYTKYYKNNIVFCCGPMTLNDEIIKLCSEMNIDYSIEKFE